MTGAEQQELVLDVARKTGLRFNVSAGSNEIGETLDLGLADLDRNEGFSVRLQLGWRSLELIFRPGSYSAQLIEQMGLAPAAGRAAFAALVQQSKAEGAVVSMSVNEAFCEPLMPNLWPPNWGSLGLSLKRSPVELDAPAERTREVKQWVGRFISLLLALLP